MEINTDDLALMLGGAILMIFIGLLLAIVVYIVTSLAFSRILKIYKYPNAWAAWVPFYRQYALADVALKGRKELAIAGLETKLPDWCFKFYWAITLVLSTFLSAMPLCSIIVLLINTVLLGTIIAEVYADIENQQIKDTAVLGYVSAVFTLVFIIKAFMYDKNLRLDNVNFN